MKKIHKTPHSIRPIVSGSSGPTENISAFMDFFIQPLVPLTSSYIKDSKHLISIMEDLTLPKDCILAAIDVTGLYLHIPHEEGIESTTDHLHNRNPRPDEVPFPSSVTKELLRVILDHNYFEFNGRMYKQIQGTAMGTKMAPAYANLFMNNLEEKFLQDCHPSPTIWKRFIDDILVIWPGSMESFNK